VYLAEDPDDSSKGYFKKEIIPYCEEVLEQNEKFFRRLKKSIMISYSERSQTKSRNREDFRKRKKWCIGRIFYRSWTSIN